MSLDRAVQRIAQTAIRAVGTAVTIQRVATPTYDPATGRASSSITTQTPPARLDVYTDREIQGTIKAGDRKVIIAAVDLDWVPSTSDRVMIANVRHEVIRVEPSIAATAMAFYTLQVRSF